MAAKTKGLGAGLGALLGDAALDDRGGASQDGAVYLPISRIEPRQGQPRRLFDETALYELTESIREHGVIQPLTVRRLDDGYYQIIAGERRWRASRMAGLSEVPARIIEADDRKAMELALVENLQREDLNPVEEAEGYRTLINEYGLTQEEAAQRVGKSRPVVTNALRLLTLPAEALALIEDGKLNLSAARCVLELEDADERVKAAREIAEKKLTVREALALVAKIKSGAKPKAKPRTRELGPDGVDYLAEVETKLSKKLGRRVKIVDGKRRGRLEIEYYGADDFENICAVLLGGKDS